MERSRRCGGGRHLRWAANALPARWTGDAARRAHRARCGPWDTGIPEAGGFCESVPRDTRFAAEQVDPGAPAQEINSDAILASFLPPALTLPKPPSRAKKPKVPPKEQAARKRVRLPSAPRGGKGKKVATVLNLDEHSASGAASGYSGAVAVVSSDEDAADTDAAVPVATKANGGAAAGYMPATTARAAKDPGKVLAGFVPATEVRGVVGSLKRQERMLDEAMELLKGNKKEVQMLRSDVRGARGAVSHVQEQFSDVAEQTSGLTASNKGIALMLKEISERLGNGAQATGLGAGTGAGAAVRVGVGADVGAVAIVGGNVGFDDDNGNDEAVQVPRAHWSPDLRVSFAQGVESVLVSRRSDEG